MDAEDKMSSAFAAMSATAEASGTPQPEHSQLLSGALTSGMGGVCRALKSHEQTLARPFRDQSALARAYCRLEFWSHAWGLVRF